MGKDVYQILRPGLGKALDIQVVASEETTLLCGPDPLLQTHSCMPKLRPAAQDHYEQKPYKYSPWEVDLEGEGVMCRYLLSIYRRIFSSY